MTLYLAPDELLALTGYRRGANSERNTVVACRACNSNKRDAHPVDFVEHLYKFAP